MVGLEGDWHYRECAGGIFGLSDCKWRHGPGIGGESHEHEDLVRERSEGAELGGAEAAGDA